MKQKYKIRFFFDYGSGTCFWSSNDKTRAKFNYPIKPEELPLPVESLKKVRDSLEWYDQSLNWGKASERVMRGKIVQIYLKRGLSYANCRTETLILSLQPCLTRLR